METKISFIKTIKPYQYLIWTVLVVATIFSISPPEQFIFKRLANHGVQLMFICLIIGLVFMVLRDPKSMWVSIVCCCILCLHLRTREPFYPIKYGTFFKIAHVNLENSTDYEQTIQALINSNPDIISFQNLDLDWDWALKETLAATHPYEKTIISLGVYNPAVYSKYPFIEMDTFHYKDAPNIHGCVKIDDNKVHFVCSVTTPPVDMNAYKEIGQHLLSIAEFSVELHAPVIVLGDYNVVTYSSEMNRFRAKGGLTDSRTNHTLIGESPVDHILYSKELECTNFTSINETSNNKIGIIGTYQFNRKYVRTTKKSKSNSETTE